MKLIITSFYNSLFPDLSTTPSYMPFNFFPYCQLLLLPFILFPHSAPWIWLNLLPETYFSFFFFFQKRIFPSKICSWHFLAQNSLIAPHWIQGKTYTLLWGRWLPTCAVSGLTSSTCFGTEPLVALCAILNLCTFTSLLKRVP